MKKLSEKDYKLLLEETEIIESDKFGEKVLKYKDGHYMKLFRLKRLFSSALIYPYWKRFVHNASGLKRLGIPTVQKIDEVLRVPHAKKTAVIYQPLAGDTLKQVNARGEFNSSLIRKFGQFVAQLHHKGVYFSSLHLGNVVLTEDNEFGLIDISDMRIVYFPIPLWTRETNLDYLFRCRQGLKLLSPEERTEFIEGYLEESKPSVRPRMEKFIRLQNAKLAESK